MRVKPKWTWKLMALLLLLLAWLAAIKVFYSATMGADPVFQLDSNHRLMGWPGFLLQYDKTIGEYSLLQIQDPNANDTNPSHIEEFGKSEIFIIANAKQGWFAVNRHSLETFGYFNDADTLARNLGIHFNRVKWVSYFPKEYLVKPKDSWVYVLIISILFVTGMLIVIFWPLKLRKQKISSSL